MATNYTERAVYTGSLMICKGGNADVTRPMFREIGYARKRGKGMYEFRPECARLTPENREEWLIAAKSNRSVELKDNEKEILKEMQDGMKYRVHEDDLVFV